MSDDQIRTTLARDLRALALAWSDEPSIAPHMGSAPGYTTGTAVRLANDAAAEIERLRAEVSLLRDKVEFEREYGKMRDG